MGFKVLVLGLVVSAGLLAGTPREKEAKAMIQLYRARVSVAQIKVDDQLLVNEHDATQLARLEESSGAVPLKAIAEQKLKVDRNVLKLKLLQQEVQIAEAELAAAEARLEETQRLAAN